MYADNFEYHTPSSVEEAVGLLGQHGDNAKIVTGGMSLIPLMKLKLATPSHLIDLRKLPGLSGITENGGNIEIGAMTTHAELAASTLLADKCPLLAQTAAEVGDAQVRNRGTIGGSLVHADPAADLPAAMLALGAQMTLAGKSERSVAAAVFFVDTMTSAANADELLVKITVSATGKNTAYLKMAHQASGFALVGVAVCLDMDGSTCKSAGIGVTGVDYRPFRATAVESGLAGKSLDAATIAAAADQVITNIQDAMEDPLNASAGYRKNLARVYTKRAIQAALG